MAPQDPIQDPLPDQIQGADGPDFVAALARGLDVLQVCADQPDGVTLAEAARRTGHTRASVRRSLLTLASRGYLILDGRDFVATPKILSLGVGLSRMPLSRLAQPLLDRLSRAHGESFSMAMLDGRDIVYVARSEARRILAVDLSVGSRLPAYCTSMGRVLLAGLPEADRAARLPASPEARTDRTITDASRLLDLLRQVDRDGYCILDQELEVGLRSLAVPVRRADGRVAIALNVSTQAGRVDLAALRRLLPALQAAAGDFGPLPAVAAIEAAP